MSSINIKFEVLPPGPGDDPSEPSAADVCRALQQQLSDPGSRLRLGEFARYAQNASLSGPGLPEDPLSAGLGRDSHGDFEMNSLARPPSPQPGPDTMFGAGCGATGSSGPFGQQGGSRWGDEGDAPHRFDSGPCGATSSVGLAGSGPCGPGACNGGCGGPEDLQHMSNATLVERLMAAERELVQKAAGGHAAPAGLGLGLGGGSRGVDLADRNAPYDVMALEEKCMHLERRLEVAERERAEAQETARSQRARADQLERKLQDREQLLVHAKEMWMKENVRASKLGETLTQTEDRLADQEKRLGEVFERYNEAQQEVRQLQHLLGSHGGGPLGSHGSLSAGVPANAGLGAAGGASGLGAAPGSGVVGGPPFSTTGFSDAYGMEVGNGADAGHTNGFSKAGWSAGGFADPALASVGDLRPSSDRSLASMPNGHGALESQLASPMEADTNADRFRRLCLLSDAVLYEDDILQVGIKMEFSGRAGQVAVYLGNKGSAALQAFTVQYFVKEDRALRLSASPLSQQLGSDEQVVQRVGVTLLEPFVEPPWLRVQFLLPDASPRRIQIRFPVVLTKFMIGRELSPTDYFRYWRQQHFVLNEVTSIVHLAARLRGALVHIARCLVFGGALRLHHGVDNNPDNFVLVGQLLEPSSGAHRPGLGAPPSAADPDRGLGGNYGGGYPEAELHRVDTLGGGDRDAGLSLVRVEIGSGRFSGKARVVVRSSSHAVARAICDGIVMQLAEPNAPHSSGVVGTR